MCGLHLVDLHLREGAACGQCRAPHLHVCHRPENPNRASRVVMVRIPVTRYSMQVERVAWPFRVEHPLEQFREKMVVSVEGVFVVEGEDEESLTL